MERLRLWNLLFAVSKYLDIRLDRLAMEQILINYNIAISAANDMGYKSMKLI